MSTSEVGCPNKWCSCRSVTSLLQSVPFAHCLLSTPSLRLLVTRCGWSTCARARSPAVTDIHCLSPRLSVPLFLSLCVLERLTYGFVSWSETLQHSQRSWSALKTSPSSSFYAALGLHGSWTKTWASCNPLKAHPQPQPGQGYRIRRPHRHHHLAIAAAANAREEFLGSQLPRQSQGSRDTASSWGVQCPRGAAEAGPYCAQSGTSAAVGNGL